MQLGLISTSTSSETSLVSLVYTKQVRKAVRYCTASVHMRTEWYNIILFQFLVHFSIPPNFWTCFGMVLDPVHTGTISYHSTSVCSKQWYGEGLHSHGYGKNQAVHSKTGPEIGQYGKVNQKLERYDIVPFRSRVNRSGMISYHFLDLFGIYE